MKLRSKFDRCPILILFSGQKKYITTIRSISSTSPGRLEWNQINENLRDLIENESSDSQELEVSDEAHELAPAFTALHQFPDGGDDYWQKQLELDGEFKRARDSPSLGLASAPSSNSASDFRVSPPARAGRSDSFPGLEAGIEASVEVKAARKYEEIMASARAEADQSVDAAGHADDDV